MSWRTGFLPFAGHSRSSSLSLNLLDHLKRAIKHPPRAAASTAAISRVFLTCMCTYDYVIGTTTSPWRDWSALATRQPPPATPSPPPSHPLPALRGRLPRESPPPGRYAARVTQIPPAIDLMRSLYCVNVDELTHHWRWQGNESPRMSFRRRFVKKLYKIYFGKLCVLLWPNNVHLRFIVLVPFFSESIV